MSKRTRAFRERLAHALEARRQRIAALRESADALLIQAIELLDRTAAIRDLDTPRARKAIADAEDLTRRMEATEVEFRETADRELDELAALEQAGHLVAREGDLLDQLIALATVAKRDGRDPDTDPTITHLENVRSIVEAERRRVDELWSP